MIDYILRNTSINAFWVMGTVFAAFLVLIIITTCATDMWEPVTVCICVILAILTISHFALGIVESTSTYKKSTVVPASLISISIDEETGKYSYTFQLENGSIVTIKTRNSCME